MEKSTTKKLNEILLNVRDENSLKDYLNNVEEKHAARPFYEYFNSLRKVKQMNRSDLSAESGIERSYCYHILSGAKENPGRDKVIRLCLAADLDYTETQKALEAAKEACLYAKDQRDAVIIYCLQKQMNVMDTNDLLDELGMKPLE